LPPPDKISKTDSNYGINHDMVKMVMHIQLDKFKEISLPRVIWVNKHSSLKDLHKQAFKFMLPAFKKIYKDFKESEHSEACRTFLPFCDPNTKEELDYEMITRLSEENFDKLFEAFFPGLNESNWN
jgi:hypothetical protein